MTSDQWGQIKQDLLKTIGKNNFTNWIEPLELTAINDDVVTFKVPTTFGATMCPAISAS